MIFVAPIGWTLDERIDVDVGVAGVSEDVDRLHLPF